MALPRRTRSLLAWLPAAILVVVIGAIVFVALAVQNSWWNQDDPAASADQQASDGSSMLSDAGFDYVNVTGLLRVRIGEGALPATELGLPPDGDKTAEFLRPLRAVVAVGDETYVVNEVTTATASAEQDRLSRLDLGFDAIQWSDAVTELRGLSSGFGWDPASIAAIEAELGEFNRTGTGDTFTATVEPTPGGAPVTASIAFDRGSGYTSLTLTFAPES